MLYSIRKMQLKIVLHVPLFLSTPHLYKWLSSWQPFSYSSKTWHILKVSLTCFCNYLPSGFIRKKNFSSNQIWLWKIADSCKSNAMQETFYRKKNCLQVIRRYFPNWIQILIAKSHKSRMIQKLLLPFFPYNLSIIVRNFIRMFLKKDFTLSSNILVMSTWCFLKKKVMLLMFLFLYSSNVTLSLPI